MRVSVWRPGDVKVTTEQDGTPEHGATSELADDGDDELADDELADDGDDELADDSDDEVADDGDDAQPARADSAATTTSAVPTRPVIG